METLENLQLAHDRLVKALAAQGDGEETIVVTFTTAQGITVRSVLQEAIGSYPTAVETPNAEAAPNLTAILQEKSKHWAFREKGAKEVCNAAFAEVLQHFSEEAIAEAIDYAATHPQYGTGLRTVSKRQKPWDWFIERIDEIQAHMDNDADYVKRVAARAKKMAVGKPKTVDGKDLPNYRQDSGKRDILKGDI
jgi:hypothetical protein